MAFGLLTWWRRRQRRRLSKSRSARHQAVVSGDAEKSFLLSYSPTPTSTDDVAVTVDSKSGLLQSIKITTKDETGEIIKKLRAELARAFPDVLFYFQPADVVTQV